MKPAKKIKDRTERLIKRKDSVVKHRIFCPCCKQTFKATWARHRSDLKDINATCDCPKCGCLLLLEGKKVSSFHIALNEKTNGVWPKDGAGTKSMNVDDGSIRDESNEARRLERTNRR